MVLIGLGSLHFMGSLRSKVGVRGSWKELDFFKGFWAFPGICNRRLVHKWDNDTPLIPPFEDM